MLIIIMSKRNNLSIVYLKKGVNTKMLLDLDRKSKQVKKIKLL